MTGGLLAAPRGRRILFTALYFAEGAPIGFVWWALPVWLHADGASPLEIARVSSLVGWPWAVKFLWAPLVDLLRGPRFGLREWILSAQAVMAVALLPLLFIDLGTQHELLVAVLVAHAVAAATQDASIDTLAVHTLHPHERGAINGWMQVGMLAARGLFGGGAVLLATEVGRPAVLLLLVAGIALPALVVAAGTRRTRVAEPARRSAAEYGAALRRMLGRRALWAGLVFTTLVGAGFEGLASLWQPLLLQRGATEEAVGAFLAVPVVVLMAGGALLGGWAADRFGRRAVTGVAEALAACAVLALGLAAWTLPEQAGTAPFFALLGAVYLAAGMATAALYGLLMDLVDPAVAAVQFCAFMAAVNLCYVWSTRALGELVARYGYGPGIVALAGVSLLALPLLALLRPARHALGDFAEPPR